MEKVTNTELKALKPVPLLNFHRNYFGNDGLAYIPNQFNCIREFQSEQDRNFIINLVTKCKPNCTVAWCDYLENESSVGCLSTIEGVELYSNREMRLNITTYRRIKIYNTTLNPVDNLYYVNYEFYDDLPIPSDKQKQVVKLINQINMIKKSFYHGYNHVGCLYFGKPLSIDEYASAFSFDLLKWETTRFSILKPAYLTQNCLTRLEILLEDTTIEFKGKKLSHILAKE
jgi:hypothetical protein